MFSLPVFLTSDHSEKTIGGAIFGKRVPFVPSIILHPASPLFAIWNPEVGGFDLEAIGATEQGGPWHRVSLPWVMEDSEVEDYASIHGFDTIMWVYDSEETHTPEA